MRRTEHLHRLEVVERVEHPEHVEARLGRLVDERLDHVVRVAGVADRVGAADQHLEEEVRHRGPERPEPRPGVLVQEAVGGVEGGAPPALQAEQLGGQLRRRRGDLQQITGPHPRGEQALVRVAHGGVGHQRPVLPEHPGRQPVRPVLVQDLLRPRQGRTLRNLGETRRRELHRAPALLGLDRGVAVDDDLAQVLEQLGGAVPPPLRREELRRVVHHRVKVSPFRKVSVPSTFSRNERLVFTPRIRNSRSARCPFWIAPSKVGREGDDLHQQRVVEPADLRVGVAVPAVQPDAEPGGRPPGEDGPRVGQEVVRRILGGDPELDREAARHDGGLARRCRSPDRTAGAPRRCAAGPAPGRCR